MDAQKLRAWRWHRQGLDGSLSTCTNSATLACAGWARSVGGVGPYLTLFARNGATREAIDRDVADLAIHELPAARNCTYVLPADHYALGLKVGQANHAAGDLAVATKYLGVTERELSVLCDAVKALLKDCSLDPKEIRAKLGDTVRSLGEEGKKRGQTTTLPLALGLLQAHGEIRRVPMNGRLDQQRYAYRLWEPTPMRNFKLSEEESLAELARLFFYWAGPTSLASFQGFAGISGVKGKAAIADIELATLDGSDLLMLKSDEREFLAFEIPSAPQYKLVSSLDSLANLRREVVSLIDEADRNREVLTEKGRQVATGLIDLPSHAIFDRGRLVGLWEFDPQAQQIAWHSWIGRPEKLLEEVERTKEFIVNQLGDARSFSLDSAESRAPRIAALGMA